MYSQFRDFFRKLVNQKLFPPVTQIGFKSGLLEKDFQYINHSNYFESLKIEIEKYGKLSF